MKRLMSLTVAVLAIASVPLAGCTSVAQSLAQTASSLSSETSTDVATYAQATQAAALTTRAVDLAVQNVTLDRATLTELSALNDGVHRAWLDLKAAHDAGQSLSFASFNAALDGFTAYATTKGVQH